MRTRSYTWIPLQPDDKEDIIRMNSECKSCGEIARYIGCSYTAVYRYLRKQGLQSRFHQHVVDRGEKILQLSIQGVPVAKIAEMLNVSKCVVHMTRTKLRKDNRL